MFCSECGTKIPDESLFCLECGKRIVKIQNDSLPGPKKDCKKKAGVSKHVRTVIIVCAVLIMVSAGIVPMYYFNSNNYILHMQLVCGSEEVRRYFGIAWGIPLIRYNRIAFALIILFSVIAIVLTRKTKIYYCTHMFALILAVMLAHFVLISAFLEVSGMVSLGFFAIVISAIVGIYYSRKGCNELKGA